MAPALATFEAVPVLIEPCGIEITFAANINSNSRNVLIEPCGIEIALREIAQTAPL